MSLSAGRQKQLTVKKWGTWIRWGQCLTYKKVDYLWYCRKVSRTDIFLPWAKMEEKAPLFLVSRREKQQNSGSGDWGGRWGTNCMASG